MNRALGRDRGSQFTDEEVHDRREGIIWLVSVELGPEPEPSDTTSRLAWGRGGDRARTQCLKYNTQVCVVMGDAQPRDWVTKADVGDSFMCLESGQAGGMVVESLALTFI